MLPAPESRMEASRRSAQEGFGLQLRNGADRRVADRSSLDSGRRGVIGALSPCGAGPTAVTEDDDYLGGKHSMGYSEEDDEFDHASTVPRILAFLDSVITEDFLCNPPPTEAVDVDADRDALDDEMRWKHLLNSATAGEMRTIATEAHQELVAALYEVITLESALVEMSDDVATLERTVGQRDEMIELLNSQLSMADEYNEELHSSKKEALRKLSDAKTELALLSQRNAELLRLLQEKEMALERRSSRRTDTLASASVQPQQHGLVEPLAVCDPRRALGTIPQIANALNKGNLSSTVSLVPCRPDGSGEIHRKLQTSRNILPCNEVAGAGDDPHAVKTECVQVRLAGHADSAPHVKSERLPRPPSEGGARDVSPLENETQMLRGILQAPEVHTAKGKGIDVGRCQATLEVDAAPERHLAVTCDLNSGGDYLSPSHGGDSDRIVSAEVNLSLLQQQLDRAEAYAIRLEGELRAERDRLRRKSETEKKLLESVVLLTRQLRSREALDRETRSLRRAGLSRVRGNDENPAEKRPASFDPSSFSPNRRASARSGVNIITESDGGGEDSSALVTSSKVRAADVLGGGVAIMSAEVGDETAPGMRQYKEATLSLRGDTGEVNIESSSSSFDLPSDALHVLDRQEISLPRSFPPPLLARRNDSGS